MKKLYPSSYALPIGLTTKAKYNNNCLRYLKFKEYISSDFPYQAFPELNKAIGVLGEERAKQLLLDRYPESDIIIEEPFKQDIGDDFIVSGRCDFLLNNDDLIVEVKTTRSPSVRTNVINKGILPESYLGQLLTYLIAFDKTKGEILVQYIHFRRDLGSIGFIDRTFHVKIDDDKLYIDDIEYEYTVTHMLSFYEIYKQTLMTDKIPPRPTSDSACYFCPFDSICNNLDQPQNTEQFIDKVRDLEYDYSKKPTVPKLPRHNIKTQVSKK